MKNRNIIVLVFLFFSNFLQAQGTTCSNADPFCTSSANSFPAGVNQPDATITQAGNNYDCLSTAPNPAWYYLEIDQPGNLAINITNNGNVFGSPADIDFAIWGPFVNLNSALNNCGSLQLPLDCSYSAFAYPEIVNVNNTVSGQVYIMLVTNYDNVACDISLSNVGAATTDCSILNPCSLNSITVAPSSCLGTTSLFNISGVINFTNPPTTGQLVVQNCSGDQVTFSPPFNSPINYLITGINGDGTTNCNVNAYFTADPTCTITSSNFDEPYCATSCDITSISNSVSSCDALGYFNLLGNIEFINQPTTGSLVVKNCSGDSTILSPPFNSPMNYNIGNIVGDGTTNCQVVAYFTDSLQCSIQGNGYTEPTCVCTINTINHSFSICDTVNQTFNMAGIVDVSWPPTTGQLIVKNCSGDSAIISPPFNSPISFTISGINADGTQNCTLTAYFTDDNNCSIVSFPFQEPNCLLPCQFIDVTTTMDSCTASGLHYSGIVTFQNQPSSGQLIVSDCNGNQHVFNPPFFSPTSYEIHDVIPNGAPCQMTAYFTADTTCTYVTPFTPDNVPIIEVEMDTAVCIGEQVELYVDTISGGLLVDQFTMVFNQAFSYTSTVTTQPGMYYLEVSGTYTAVGMPHIRDAAFNYGAFNPPLQNIEWKWNGQNPNTQSVVPTVYNPNHVYQFFFQGGSVQNFSFSELQANWYNDNFGQLNFKIYYLGNMYWSNGVTTFNNIINPTLSSDYIIYLDYVNGCSSSDTVRVEVSDLQHTVQTTSLTCIGLSDGSIDFDFSGGLEPLNYNWSHTALNTDSLVGLDTGSYQLIVTDSIGCSDSILSTIIGPQLITINQIDTIRELCFGDCSGQMTVSATGAYFYSIDSLNFQTDSSFSGLCSGTYHVYLRDSAGCQNFAPFSIISPAEILLSPSSDTTICIGGTANVTVQGIGGTGSLTYFTNDLPSSNSQLITPLLDSILCISAADANGCRSDTHCVNVAIFPPLQIASINDIDICIGDTVVVLAQVSGGSGVSYNYNWTPLNSNDSIVLLQPSSTQQYTLTVTENCETPASSEDFEIVVNQYPVVEFSADVLSSCLPLETTFTSVISPSSGSCLWDLGDGTLSTTCNNVSHVYVDSGCYDISLQVTSTEGCTTVVDKSQYVCARDIPIPIFDWDPDTSTMMNTYIEFYNSSIGATSYEWQLDVNGNLYTITEEEFPYTFPNFQSGTYPICLTATNDFGCDSTVCDEVRILDHFFIYTPTGFTPGDEDLINDEFIPVIYGAQPESYSLQVFDRWGGLIFESNEIGYGWNGKHQKTGELCALGVYVWRITVRDEYSPTLYDYIGNVTLIR